MGWEAGGLTVPIDATPPTALVVNFGTTDVFGLDSA
jgi:hypothetical protein